MPLASIPLPDGGVWHVGGLTIRAYALTIITAILIAALLTARRYGDRRLVWDVAAWAIPFGLLGAAAHALLVATRHDFTPAQFDIGTDILAAIGVPGSIALGVAGAWIGCRRAGIPLGPMAGAAAPGVAFGLAIGGLGHWWAQDFYGGPASWWLAERIAPPHRVAGFENFAKFQPAFLYQSLWDIAVGLGLIWAGRRFALTGARTFLLGAAAYAAGSLWVTSTRIGPQLRMLGIPYDVVADIVVLIAAAAAFWWLPGRPAQPRLAAPKPPHVISK